MRALGLGNEHLSVAVRGTDPIAFEHDEQTDLVHDLEVGAAAGTPIGALAGLALVAVTVPGVAVGGVLALGGASALWGLLMGSYVGVAVGAAGWTTHENFEDVALEPGEVMVVVCSHGHADTVDELSDAAAVACFEPRRPNRESSHDLSGIARLRGELTDLPYGFIKEVPMSHEPHGGTAHHADSEHRRGVPTLRSVVDAFDGLERSDLEEVAVEYLLAHARMCRLATGAEHAGDDHATDEQMTQRIGEMGNHELAELLAPPAWLAIVARAQHA